MDPACFNRAVLGLVPILENGIPGQSLLSPGPVRSLQNSARPDPCPPLIAITHLFFVDDSMVFCKENEMEAGYVIKILEDYGKVSGQIINMEKSSIFLGRAV